MILSDHFETAPSCLWKKPVCYTIHYTCAVFDCIALEISIQAFLLLAIRINIL